MDMVGSTDLSTLHYPYSWSKQVCEMSPCSEGAQRLMPQRHCCINLRGVCRALTPLTNPVEIIEAQEKDSWRKRENPVTFLLSKRMMSSLVRRQIWHAFSARTQGKWRGAPFMMSFLCFCTAFRCLCLGKWDLVEKVHFEAAWGKTTWCYSFCSRNLCTYLYWRKFQHVGIDFFFFLLQITAKVR